MNEKQTAAIQKFRNVVLKAKNDYESLGKIDIGAWLGYTEIRSEARTELCDAIPILWNSTTSDLMTNINKLPAFIKEREKYRDIQNEKKEKEKLTEETDTVPKEKKKGRRGRKSIKIEFPAGKFTIPELAKELRVSVTTIYNAMGKNVKKVGEVKRRPGQRGKLTPIYRVSK